MPWTAKDAKGWLKDATDKQAEVGAQVANEALARCQKAKGEDCEGAAIRQAKSVMQKLNESAGFGEAVAVALVESLAVQEPLVFSGKPLAEISLTDGASVQDFMRTLETALRAKLNPANAPGIYAWPVDVYESELVYELSGKYCRAPYSVEGDVVTIGDGEEVERVATYRPKKAITVESVVDALTKHARTMFVEETGGFIPQRDG